MKTNFLVGLVVLAAMNMMACTDMLGGLGGCSAADPAVDMHVAPLTFQEQTATETCDATNGVVLDLTDAQGSSIHVAVLPSVQLGASLPLTADAPISGPVAASSSADGTVKVTLTDAEYNELPAGWQSASVTITQLPRSANDVLIGQVEFYFADGRTLAVNFDNVLATACPATPTN